MVGYVSLEEQVDKTSASLAAKRYPSASVAVGEETPPSDGLLLCFDD
jgi:hypothetical protein